MGQSIGATIRMLRQDRGLTPAELGHLLDITEDTVLRWESDSLAPELSQIPLLAQQLGTEPERLTASIPPRVSQTAFRGLPSAIWFHLILSVVGFLAGVVFYCLQMPVYGFFVGGSLIVISLLMSFRKKGTRRKLFFEPLFFGSLLPLLLITDLSPMGWFTYGTAFAAVTALACLAAWFLLTDHKAISKVQRICLRYGLILLAILLLVGALHFLVQYLLRSTDILYSGSVVFDNWEDFQSYMQKPLASDGKTEMSLLSVTPKDGNLVYRFSDPASGIVEITDALKTIPNPLGGDAFCSYLHLNQSVYSFKLSSSGSLPVQIITLADELQAARTLQTVTIAFFILYAAIIVTFILIVRRKILTPSETTDTAQL